MRRLQPGQLQELLAALPGSERRQFPFTFQCASLRTRSHRKDTKGLF